MKKLLLIILINISVTCCVYAQQVTDIPEKPYWKEKQEGWFWYKDPPPPLVIEKQKPSTEKAKVDTRRPELIEFEAYQKEVEDTRKIAIMNPTEENVKIFMRAHKSVSDKAQALTKMWQVANWTDQTLSYSQTEVRPANILAMSIYDQELRAKQRAQVAKLSKTHGLFFFFKGDCSYCHALAPLLKTFSYESNMTVFPISLDGEGLPEYPNPATDNGTAARMEITTVPALVLAVPSTGEKQIISFGVITESELYERIYKLTTTPETQAQF